MNPNIATPDQRHSIVTLTLELMQQYLHDAVPMDATDVDDLNTHMEDIAYMSGALREFVRDNDMKVFESRIMWQDTYVREYYVKVLWMIVECLDENYDEGLCDELSAAA